MRVTCACACVKKHAHGPRTGRIIIGSQYQNQFSFLSRALTSHLWTVDHISFSDHGGMAPVPLHPEQLVRGLQWEEDTINPETPKPESPKRDTPLVL